MVVACAGARREIVLGGVLVAGVRNWMVKAEQHQQRFKLDEDIPISRV